MKDFFKSWFYIIKTGDTKAKVFYIFAFVALVAAVAGAVAGIVGFVPTAIAGQPSFLPLGISIFSIAIGTGVIIWMNKLRGI